MPMRTIMTTAAAVALLLSGAVVGGAGPATAQPLDTTTPSCAGIAGTPEAASVWWGHFAGGRESPTDGTSAPIGATLEGCFPTRGACERWLYEMKGEYSALLLPPGTNGCRRGYRGME
jgi:hypothetical protein